MAAAHPNYRPDDGESIFRVESDPAMEAAMSALRDATIEPDSTAQLEIGVMRAWRQERRTQSVQFWMPTLMGAVIAAGLTLAIIQLIFVPVLTEPGKKIPALSSYTEKGDIAKRQ